MGSVPLKLKDSADFQNFTSTEENYLAYQVGLSLAEMDSSSPAALSLYGTDSATSIVGYLTNTAYDSAVGTGGDGSFLTFSTTTTTLRQTTGTVAIADSDYRLPLIQRDSDGKRVIREMNDSDTSVLLERLNSRIFTSDYVGTYRMGSSAPSGDYSVYLNDVMTDTRSDGHSLQYNIYQRTNQTSPTQVLPFSIKRSNGDSGDYQGLQLMTPRQIKYSLGLKSKNKIASNTDGIGAYRVYSSAIGTPTDVGLSGTWAAKGTATDTRQQIVDVNYTRGRVSTYSRLRQSAFSADYTRTRSSAYSQNYTRTRTSTYSADYTSLRSSNYSVGFVGNYIGNYTRTSTRDSQRTRSSVFDYVGNYVGDFTGNYSRLLSFAGNFTGNYSRTSTDVTLIHTLLNPNPIGTTTYDYFGYEVSIDGDYAIVGAYGELSAEDLNGYSSGKAYIFNTTTGALVHTLDNPNAYGTTGGDSFGSTLGISGNYAIVGAVNEDDAGGSSSGKAYIYNVTTGALVHTLNNPNAYGTSAGDRFGQSVEIDGNYAIVGASDEDDAGGGGSGKAYIYNVTTGALLHTLDNPNAYGTSTGDGFGRAVDVSGNYAIVGAQYEDGAGVYNSGRAYIFNVTTGALVHTLDNPNAYGTAEYDDFAFNVSISGNYAIVGAYMEDEAGGDSSGKAYIFNVTTGALVHTLDNPNAYGTPYADNFGWGVSISGDYAIVSAKGEDEASGDNSGKVYIFNVTTGTLVKTLDNPNAYGTPAGDSFGQKVDISGNYIIAGVYVNPTYGTATPKAYIFNMVTPADSFTRDSTRTSTRISTYTRNVTQDFLGNYTRTLNYLGNYTGDFLGEYSADYTRTTPDDFSRNFIGNYAGEFTRNRASTFTRTRGSTYIGNYIGDYVGDYLGNFTGDFVGNYTGNYVGGDSSATEKYSTASPIFRWYNYYIPGGKGTGTYVTSVTWNGTQVYTASDSTAATNWNFTTVVGTDGITYYRGTLRSSPVLSTDPRDYAIYRAGGQDFTRTSTRTSLLSSTRTSLRTSTSDFTRTTSQNFVGDYSRNFLGNYSRNFTRTRSSNFLGGDTFSRDFLGNFIGNYSRDFTLNFEGNYSRNFAGNYQGDYSRNFIGDYSRTFTGNYAGNTIGSGNTNIQTYTLYVRIA